MKLALSSALPLILNRSSLSMINFIWSRLLSGLENLLRNVSQMLTISKLSSEKNFWTIFMVYFSKAAM